AFETLGQRQRNVQARQMQPAGEQTDEFLQGAERAEPAAERTASPDHEADQREGDEQQRDRIVEKTRQTLAGLQRLERAGDLDDGELPLHVPADVEQRKAQEAEAENPQAPGVDRNPARAGEDDAEQEQRDAQDGEVESALLPGQEPLRQ